MTVSHQGPRRRGVLSILAALRWRFAQTIYSRGVISPADREWLAPIKRVMLPAYDIAAVIGGFYAVFSGIPAIEQSMAPALADGFGYTFAVTACVCLIGILFPRLWAVEIAGKLVLVGLLGLYFGALRALADETGSGTRDFLSVVVVMATMPALLGLWILAVELGKRNKAKAALRAALSMPTEEN